MLKELVECLVELGQQGLRPEVLSLPGQPAHLRTLAMPEGRLETIKLPPEPRAHKVQSLASLTDFVDVAQKSHGNGVVWYSRLGVTFIIDDDTRRDRVTLAFRQSEPIKQLAILQNATWFDQKQMLRLLRVMFAGCLCSDALLAAVRNIKWRLAEDGLADIQHGKASLGKSITAELTGAGSIPDEVFLEVPAFEGEGQELRRSVACALEIDPETKRFCLLPYPGQLGAFWVRIEAAIRERLDESLADAEVPIYHGEP